MRRLKTIRTDEGWIASVGAERYFQEGDLTSSPATSQGAAIAAVLASFDLHEIKALCEVFYRAQSR